VWAILGIVSVAGLFYLAGKKVETRYSEPPATITVSGDGRVFAVPDIARLTLGVQTGRQPTAKKAMEILSTRMNAVLDAVKGLGIEEKDIRTQQLWMNPVYDWTEGGQIFRGFEATQNLEVKVRELDKASDVLGAATNAGANQAGGIQFTIDNPDALQAQAREEAIDEAQQKAEVLAASLGLRLGKIKGFTEGGQGWAVPSMMMRAMDAGVGGAMEKSVPLPAGEQEITSTVSITYEIR
jgi:uncharacterized protein YggE